MNALDRPSEGGHGKPDWLSRIEQLAQQEDYWGPVRSVVLESRDVLALVAIARASQQMVDLDDGYLAGAPHYGALRHALARLDGDGQS